jgi:GNAT superfamily N-acetyltransferase
MERRIMKLMRVTKYDPTSLKSFFQPLRFTIAIDAIIEGTSKGAVWMNDPSDLTLAVLWDFADGIYVMTTERINQHLESLKSLLFEEIIPEAEKEKASPLFVMYIFPECDNKQIHALFDSTWNISKQRASFYEYQMGKDPSKRELGGLPLSYEGSFMNKSSLHDSSISKMDVLRKEIEADWESIDDFLTCGIGYHVRNIEDNSLASWVYIEKIAGSCAEFAIETQEHYRRQGLGQYAAREMIRKSQDLGLIPQWYCFSNNIASVKLAEKLGFQKMQDFDVYVIQK